MISYHSGSNPINPDQPMVPEVVRTPQRIDTTRAPDGGLSTTTTGPQALPTVAQNNPNNSASMVAIADYLKQKNAAVAQQQGGMGMPTVAQAPAYQPQLGSAPAASAPAKISRVRTIRGYQDPNRQEIYGSGKTSQAMNPGTNEIDYYLGDGLGWSIDAKYGTLEGNIAAADKSMLYQMGKPINT